MNILVLGSLDNPVSVFLHQAGCSVVSWDGPPDVSVLKKRNFDWAVSYRYKYIVNQKFIDFLDGNIINLHISYLPWNRGVDPNFWSFFEDTPKGVSIHFIDVGVDTGDIIAQKEIWFDNLERHTLSSTYAHLNCEMIEEFKRKWGLIANGTAPRTKQVGIGSFHKKKDLTPYLPLLEKGWDTPVLTIQGRGKR